MSDLRESDVLEIGREAAYRLLGDANVKHVSVKAHPDTTNDPAYHFMIVATQDPDRLNAIHIQSELGRTIRDALIERGDESYPYFRIIDPRDWEYVKGA